MCSAWSSARPSRWRASLPGSATLLRWAPGHASAEPRPGHGLEEPHQVPVDFLRRLFMAEMPCASDGYVASVWRVALGADDRVGKHVGIGLAAEVQQRQTELLRH